MDNCILKLIRAELCGTEIGELDISDDEALGALYRLSVKQDLTHVVGASLMKSGLAHESAWFSRFRQARIAAVARHEQREDAQRQLCSLLCREKIPFILLKGASIRAYYPYPEMRTSCDIDLLVHPEDIGIIAELFFDAGYRKTGEGGHDVRFVSPGGVLAEVHFTLMEETQYPQMQPLLSEVWRYAIPSDQGALHTLTPEFAYFYHIAHMVKHYEYGGCGIRTLMDLWVLRHRGPALDEILLHRMLSESGTALFEEHVHALAEHWFSGVQPDIRHQPLYEMMEEYILTGGIYGSAENRVKIGRLQTGGGFRYLLARVFVPGSRLKYEYPILQKYPCLLPFCEVLRWFRLFSRKTANRIRREVRYNRELSAEAQDAAELMMRSLGLR